MTIVPHELALRSKGQVQGHVVTKCWFLVCDSNLSGVSKDISILFN